MNAKWTAERDQKLLMLNIMDVKMNWDRMSALWAQEFPDESFKPTPKAIQEHVSKMKRDMKANGTAVGTAKSTPKSGTKRAAPKTPSSSNKKARTSRMSDDDDSDDEKIMSFDSPVPKREKSVRSSARKSKSYAESDSEQGGADNSTDELASASRAYLQAKVKDTPSGTNSETPRDSHSPIGAQRSSIARSKKTTKLSKIDSDEDDGDFYNPALL